MQTNQMQRIAFITCEKSDTSNQEPRIVYREPDGKLKL